MLGCSQVSVNMITSGSDEPMMIAISSFLCLILWQFIPSIRMPYLITLELVFLILALLCVAFGEEDAQGSPIDVLMLTDEMYADEFLICLYHLMFLSHINLFVCPNFSIKIKCIKFSRDSVIYLYQFI